MKRLLIFMGILSILMLSVTFVALGADNECTSQDCEHLDDVDDCAYCCPGLATCCTCCAANYPSGTKQYAFCVAYCTDVHTGNCPIID